MADRLIIFVSQHPVLFDKRDKNYKDNDLKDNVWRKIASDIECDDVEEVKKHWKNLRDTYVRKKREEGDVKSGQAGGKQKKKWKYMEAMSFLDESTSFRSTQSNVDVEEEQEEVAGSAQHVDQVESEGECGAVAPRPAKRKSSDMLEEYLKRKEAREAEREKERSQKDDITLFLLSLAPAMRRLSQERQSWVKLKMQELCHEAEFGAVYQPQQFPNLTFL